jgi:hypothetical protein
LWQIGTLEKRHGFRTADTTIPIRIRSSKKGIKNLRVIRHNNRSEKTASRLTLNAVSVMIHCNKSQSTKTKRILIRKHKKQTLLCLPHSKRCTASEMSKVNESKEKIMKSKRS